ncbi:MAG: c-type cytochrome biogenesis protein CcsB [Clostridia bacterium]|nr:c-type cytochrome biogenesis protein CcsB [Clostridia bacterium]
MRDACFFGALMVYFAATAMQFAGVALKRTKLTAAAAKVFAAGLVLHTVYSVWRGVDASRLPLANQFEFASGFAWACAVLGVVLHLRMKQDWVLTVSAPAAFLVTSYAAFQPMEIKDLMPALRSVWFGLHIGSAAFSYAAFAIAGGLGVYYLVKLSRGADAASTAMRQADYMAYRMICLGFLLLTVVILSGAIWAEQAWSSWWSWDPKETWALITWIIYAIYLHQRLRLNWQGKRMAILAIISLVCVLFTFAGVNILLPGLHSYA